MVRQVPIETILKFERMIGEANTDSTTMNRLWRLFSDFQDLNPHENRTVQVGLFVVDMVQQGLKPSSAITYSRLLLEAASRSGQPFTGPIMTDILKCLNLQDAMTEVEHAPDIDPELAWRIVLAMEGKPRLTGFCLLAIGARCADAERLTSASFRFNAEGRLFVSFRVTKNHRSANSAYSISLVPQHLVPELVEVIRQPSKTPIATLTCADFNKEVAKIVTKLGIRQGITSYSFRRCFVQHVIADNVTGDYVDWLAVAKLTGHMSVEVLRNKYTVPFQNTL